MQFGLVIENSVRGAARIDQMQERILYLVCGNHHVDSTPPDRNPRSRRRHSTRYGICAQGLLPSLKIADPACPKVSFRPHFVQYRKRPGIVEGDPSRPTLPQVRCSCVVALAAWKRMGGSEGFQPLVRITRFITTGCL